MDSRKPSTPAGPFRSLGKQLKAFRDRAKETLAEASGAVEVDVKQLARYELGQVRPSEDVLLLLISHFALLDDEAVKLWELAGYGMTKLPLSHAAGDNQGRQSSELTSDKRILFTDVVDVIVNSYGVVMSFMQSSGGPDGKPVPVARVGMSREHAKSVLQILQVTLSQTERSAPRLPKKLIAPDNSTPDDSLKN
jgi:transcriptional regulator with XRE-family HTH domain